MSFFESSIGVGLRPPHYSYLESRPETKIQWFEAISENYMDSEGRPVEMLEFMRKNYPIALHGVGLSIASEGISKPYLKNLQKLIQRIDPFLVSDHLCWTGDAHGNLHDLLPLPFTKEVEDLIVSQIVQVQDFLKRKFYFENVSTYLQFEESEMTEWEFIRNITTRSGCGLLLDVNNVYVSATNHRFDPKDYIQGLDLSAVGQIHLAGHTDMGDFLFDTHSKPVCEEVWNLLEWTLKKLPPSIPILLEWDDDVPNFQEVEKEALKAKAIWEKSHALA